MLNWVLCAILGHKWKILNSNIVNPTHSLQIANLSIQKEIAMICVGYTSITKQCERCTNVTKDIIIGK